MMWIVWVFLFILFLRCAYLIGTQKQTISDLEARNRLLTKGHRELIKRNNTTTVDKD